MFCAPAYKALECKLTGLPPTGGQWTSEARQRLIELCPSHDLHDVEVVHRPQAGGERGEGCRPLAEVEVYMGGAEEGEIVAASEVLLEEEGLFE